MARHHARAASAASAILIAISLAGCGEKPAGGNDGEAAATATAGGMPTGWKATDACAILDKAEVAAALAQPVTEAQLGLVHEAGTADAATSECTYVGADGASVATLMTRWSPIGDNNAESMATARNASASALKAFSDKQIEDVPGLGKAAFYVPGIDAINVFVDDARMVIVTVRKVPDGASGKDVAIALARKAGAG